MCAPHKHAHRPPVLSCLSEAHHRSSLYQLNLVVFRTAQTALKVSSCDVSCWHCVRFAGDDCLTD